MSAVIEFKLILIVERSKILTKMKNSRTELMDEKKSTDVKGGEKIWKMLDQNLC